MPIEGVIIIIPPDRNVKSSVTKNRFHFSFVLSKRTSFNRNKIFGLGYNLNFKQKNFLFQAKLFLVQPVIYSAFKPRMKLWERFSKKLTDVFFVYLPTAKVYFMLYAMWKTGCSFNQYNCIHLFKVFSEEIKFDTQNTRVSTRKCCVWKLTWKE